MHDTSKDQNYSYPGTLNRGTFRSLESGHILTHFSGEIVTINPQVEVKVPELRRAQFDHTWWGSHPVCCFSKNTDENILTKISTHSYQGFVFNTKSSILNRYSTLCTTSNCHVCNRRSWALSRRVSHNFYLPFAWPCAVPSGIIFIATSL